MLDIPEVLIMLLTTLLVVLSIRHWMIRYRAVPTKKTLGDSGLQPATRPSVAKDAQAT